MKNCSNFYNDTITTTTTTTTTTTLEDLIQKALEVNFTFSTLSLLDFIQKTLEVIGSSSSRKSNAIRMGIQCILKESLYDLVSRSASKRTDESSDDALEDCLEEVQLVLQNLVLLLFEEENGLYDCSNKLVVVGGDGKGKNCVS